MSKSIIKYHSSIRNSIRIILYVSYTLNSELYVAIKTYFTKGAPNILDDNQSSCNFDPNMKNKKICSVIDLEIYILTLHNKTALYVQ